MFEAKIAIAIRDEQLPGGIEDGAVGLDDNHIPALPFAGSFTRSWCNPNSSIAAGAIPVPLNRRLATPELRFIIDHCGPTVLIYEER